MDINKKIIPFQLHPLGIINSFTHYGADLDTLLNAAMVNTNALQSSTEKISYHQFFLLIKSGIRQCNHPQLGLFMSHHFNWIYHGVTGMAMKASSTFNQAGIALQRYSCIAQPYYMPFRCTPFVYLDNKMRIIIPIKNLMTRTQIHTKINTFEIEFRLGMLIKILSEFCNDCHEVISSSKVELTLDKPSDLTTYNNLIGKNIEFNCPHSRLILPAKIIQQKPDILRKGIYKNSIEHCNQELRKITHNAPNTEHVRTLLVEKLPHYPSINVVAEKMGITTRTLARKLNQEGSSFTDILNNVRSEVAIYFLQATNLSTEDVSESLGFSDTHNFRQAFQRWTGQSSCSYRQQNNEVIGGC